MTQSNNSSQTNTSNQNNCECCWDAQEIQNLIETIKNKIRNLKGRKDRNDKEIEDRNDEGDEEIFDTQNIFALCLNIRISGINNNGIPLDICLIYKNSEGWKRRRINRKRFSNSLGNFLGLNNQKGIYIIFCNFFEKDCIIYIGGQKPRSNRGLIERLKNFIKALMDGGRGHTGGLNIHNYIKNCIGNQANNKNNKNLCLIVLAFPLKDNHNDKVYKVEGCFHSVYQNVYKCKCYRYYQFVRSASTADFTIFSNPNESKEVIKKIFEEIRKLCGGAS